MSSTHANSIRLGAFWIGLTVASLLGWTPTALGRQALDMQDVYLGLGAATYAIQGDLDGSRIWTDPIETQHTAYIGKLTRANGETLQLGALIFSWFGIEYTLDRMLRRATHQNLAFDSETQLIAHRAGFRLRLPLAQRVRLNLRFQAAYQELIQARFGATAPGQFAKLTLFGNGRGGSISLETLNRRGHWGIELRLDAQTSRWEAVRVGSETFSVEEPLEGQLQNLGVVLTYYL